MSSGPRCSQFTPAPPLQKQLGYYLLLSQLKTGNFGEAFLNFSPNYGVGCLLQGMELFGILVCVCDCV